MSNGATAAFWYAAYASSRFAGFYAFSPGPVVDIDQATFRRIPSNVAIISVSAKDDSVYPYEQVNTNYENCRKQATGWIFETRDVGGHGFIYSPDGVDIIQQTLEKLMSRK